MQIVFIGENFRILVILVHTIVASNVRAPELEYVLTEVKWNHCNLNSDDLELFANFPKWIQQCFTYVWKDQCVGKLHKQRKTRRIRMPTSEALQAWRLAWRCSKPAKRGKQKDMRLKNIVFHQQQWTGFILFISYSKEKDNKFKIMTLHMRELINYVNEDLFTERTTL